MSDFTKAGENLVRHKSGTYYLRAKVAGKNGPVRVSLDTKDLRVAKIARDARLPLLRAAAEKEMAERSGDDGTRASRGRIETLGDALALISARTVGQAHNKRSTIVYNEGLVKTLRETLEDFLALHPRRFNEQAARDWWGKIASRFFWIRANTLLRLLRKVMEVAVEKGLIMEDPTALLRPVREKRKLKVMPTAEEFERVLEEMRRINRKTSPGVRLMVEFMAYSGLRPGEAREVRWEDVVWIKKKMTWLRVLGEPDEGTKNRRERMVPFSDKLRGALMELWEPGATGKLFEVSSPRFALANACKRAGVPHLRVQDLRHYFTTWAIESGVDIPTVAKWLGHQDGGALLMKTYGHVRDEHGLAKVKLLK